MERRGPVVSVRAEHGKMMPVATSLVRCDSMLPHLANPDRAPEVLELRESMQLWCFYDHFRTDRDAPVRQLQIGTRTPILSQDRHDLAAAIQTIREIGNV